MDKKNLIDADFIRPFLIETVEVFEVQANTKILAGAVYKLDAHADLSGDITGVVGLVSDQFVGSIVISFPERTFLKVVSRVMSKEITMITRDIIDGAGEFTNMIFSRAKTTLNSKGMGVKSALPTIVVGKAHHLCCASLANRTVIPFDSDVGKFTVEIFLAQDTLEKTQTKGSSKTRILVVDDSQMTRDTVTADLRALGSFDIDTAGDGQVALDKLGTALKAGSPFDLIILDWNMPVLDGLSVVQTMRKTIGMDKCYIAMLTAESDPENIKKAKEAGVNIFINKPFNRMKLKAFMDKFNADRVVAKAT